MSALAGIHQILPLTSHLPSITATLKPSGLRTNTGVWGPKLAATYKHQEDPSSSYWQSTCGDFLFKGQWKFDFYNNSYIDLVRLVRWKSCICEIESVKTQLWALNSPDQLLCRARLTTGQKPPQFGPLEGHNKPSPTDILSSSELSLWPPQTPLDSSVLEPQISPGHRTDTFSRFLSDDTWWRWWRKSKQTPFFSNKFNLLWALVLNAAPTGDHVVTFLPKHVQNLLCFNRWTNRPPAGILIS